MDMTRFLDLIGLEPDSEQPATHEDEPVTYVHVPPSRAQTIEFERSLRSILARKQESAAGRMQFLGLADIQTRLGARWAELEPRVQKLAQQTIEKHLGENDIVARFDELTYVIVFAGLDKDAAAVKCAQVSEEIQRGLFGDEGVKPAHIRTLVGVADDQLVFEDRTLAECLAALATRGDGEAPPGPAARGAPAPARPAPRPAAPPQDAAPASPKPYKFLYMPAWNARKEAVSAYRCLPARQTEQGLLLGYRAVQGGPPTNPADNVDILALEHTLDIVPALLARDAQFLTLLSVHYDTLAAPKARQAYLEASERIATDIKRYMLVEIYGAPPSVPASRHTEFVAGLHAHFGNVLIRASLHGEHFQRGAGMSQFDGFTVGIHGEPGGLESLHWALHRFAHQAQSYHGTSCALEIDTPGALRAAIDAGFTYVDGPAVLAPVEAPAHVHRCPKAKLLGSA
jgi:hypothetical protein